MPFSPRLPQPLFDAYVIVDWSAASTPRLGKDSIWYCVLERFTESTASSSGRAKKHAGLPVSKQDCLQEKERGLVHPDKSTRTKPRTRSSADGKQQALLKTADLVDMEASSGGRKRKAWPRGAGQKNGAECGGEMEGVDGAEADDGDGDSGVFCRVENVPTRAEAEGKIREMAKGWVKDRRRVLVGFDFSFAFPRGFAASLGLSSPHTQRHVAGPTGRDGIAPPPWRKVWDHLADRIRDLPTNANNRFEVAAELNRQVSGGPFPFWGCPQSQVSPFLSPKKASVLGGGHTGEKGQLVRSASQLSERREAEARCGAQSSWKLFTTGAVGSQSFLGIPRLLAIRDDEGLAPFTRVWPFETGLEPPPPSELGVREPLIILAEVYPSLVAPVWEAGEPKDAGQVRALAHYFADLDSKGHLSELFRGPLASRMQNLGAQQQRKNAYALEAAKCEGPVKGGKIEINVIVEEEGWILGVT